MSDNNTHHVHASIWLRGTAIYDQAPCNWPDDLAVRVYPNDRSSRQLIRAAGHRLADEGDTGTFIPASVMLGQGKWARKPSGLARWLSALLRGRKARVRFGAPTTDPDRPKALYFQGIPPAMDSLADIQARVVNEPDLAQALTDPASRKRVGKLIRELAARPNIRLTGLFDRVLAGFWGRFYTGIQVSGLDQVRTELGDRVPLYLVTHRSHLDYLLVSWQLHRAGLTPPVIAAGINLNLPIIGRILRFGGAFFIRRQFKGDVLYQKTVRAYLSSLVRRRQPILIFPEGGRSRDGQCRPLKLGLVKDLLAAAEHSRIAIVPVSLAYDRMPDSQGYRYELEGRKKRSETLTDLPKAWRMLRSDPLGQVYANFSRPFDMNPSMTLADIEGRLLHDWQRDMPQTTIAMVGLVLPGFTGHRATRSELNRAMGVVAAVSGIAESVDIQPAIDLGYLSVSDDIVHAPASGRDQLLYAAGAMRHRAIALSLVAIGRLSGASNRRINSLFELVWPVLALNNHLPSDPKPLQAQASAALQAALLEDAEDNAQYRLLAALAEPVVADVTRLLSVLKVCLDQPNHSATYVVDAARQQAKKAMLLSGRSELSVLDAKPYHAFVESLQSQGAWAAGALSPRAQRLAKRWLAGFAQIDRQFLL